MGSYSTVELRCPSCQKVVKFQSKAGRWYETFPLTKAPLLVLADLAYESSCGRVVCTNCHTKISVVVQTTVHTEEYVQPVDDDDL